MNKYEFLEVPRLIKINSWYRINTDENIPFDGWAIEFKGKRLNAPGGDLTIRYPGKTPAECFMNALFFLHKHNLIPDIIKNWKDWTLTLENEYGQLIR